MLVIDANPKLDRQYSHEGPPLLWRDRRRGGREGLLLLLEVCPIPGCLSLRVQAHGVRVDEHLLCVEVDGTDVVTRHDGPCPEPPDVFHLALDLEAGRVEQVAPGADRSAVSWLAGALDAELLGALRREFLRLRAVADAKLDKRLRRGDGRIGRNDPCPCGSGKKYKHCCAGMAREQAASWM